MFHLASEEKRAAAYRAQQDAAKARRAYVTSEYARKYLAEPDRTYAEDFYGEILRERGVDPATL